MGGGVATHERPAGVPYDKPDPPSNKPEQNSAAAQYSAYHKGLDTTSADGDTVHISDAARQKSIEAQAASAPAHQTVLGGLASAVKNGLGTAEQFTVGVLSSVGQDMSLGAWTAPQPDDITKAYTAGRVVGDVAGAVAGAVMAVNGAQNTASAVALAAVGSPTIVVPVVAAGAAALGAVETTTGVALFKQSIENLGSDVQQLAQSEDDTTSGSTQQATEVQAAQPTPLVRIRRLMTTRLHQITV